MRGKASIQSKVSPYKDQSLSMDAPQWVIAPPEA
jgi:hypothetical protein